MPLTTEQVRTRLKELIGFIQSGKIMEAMREFYAEDATMQENANEPKKGLENLIEHERTFLDNVKEWKRFDVLSMATYNEVSFMENLIEYVSKDGTTVVQHQVSVARWGAPGGGTPKIMHERFYYDAGGK